MPGSKSRESEKITSVKGTVNPVPVFVPEKIPAIFDGNFSPKFPYKMVSARDFVSKFNLGKKLKNDRSKLLVSHVLKRFFTLNGCAQRPNVSKYARRVLNSFLCALEACLVNLELP